MIIQYSGELAALCVSLLWAIATVIFNVATRSIRSVDLNLLKCGIAVIFLALTMLLIGEPVVFMDFRSFSFLLLSGVIGFGIGDTTYFESLKRIGARRILLLYMLAPPLTAIVALFLLNEALSLLAWAGIILTITGVGWVVMERTTDNGVSHPSNLAGIGFGLVTVICTVCATIMARYVFGQSMISPLQSAVLRLAAGSLFLFIWYAFSQRNGRKIFQNHYPLTLWGLVLLATFLGTYLTVWLQQMALKLAPAGIVQTLMAISPLFVLPISLFMGEKVTLRSFIGVLLGFGGIFLLFAYR